MYTQELSLQVNTGGASEALSISGTSAQSLPITAALAVTGDAYVVAYSTVDCFIRQGSNPTALNDGTDQFLPANLLVRLNVPNGMRIAAITSAVAGTLYLTSKV